MLLACFAVGWSPTFLAFGSILVGMLIVMLSYGLGLIFWRGERVLPRFGEHCGHAADGGYLVLAGAVLLDHGA